MADNAAPNRQFDQRSPFEKHPGGIPGKGVGGALAFLGPVTWTARKALFSGRKLTARRRALPDFIIVGAQKSGTSSLYNYLCQHPSILPAAHKEVHFFDFHFQKGTLWYRSHFPMRLGAAGTRGTCITGEATPYYLVHPAVASRCRETLPDVRLIFVLRNPIDRAYSHYQHCVRRGRDDARTFEEALAREPERLAKEAQKMPRDGNFVGGALQHHSYLRRGAYIDDIERWLALYPREQMLFLSTEELLHEGQNQYNRIVEFLGLSSFMQVNWRKENVGSYPDMSAETRTGLINHFRPFNERLFEFLGHRFPWDN